MSSKKIIAFIVLLLIVILAVFSVFFSINKKKNNIKVIDPTDSSFPTGGDSGNSGFPENKRGGDTNQILNPGEILDGSGDVVKKEEAVLRQITTEPVAAAHITQQIIIVEDEILTETEEGEVEREVIEIEENEYLTTFIQKKNGHILVDSDRREDKEKKLNQTIPQTEQGLLSNNFALLQYLDSTKEVISSFGGFFFKETIIETEENEDGETIEKEVIKETFKNTPLPTNILNPSLSPDKSSLVFSTRSNSGTNIITAKTNSLEKASLVYSTPLFDISVEWGSDNELYIKSKPDSRSVGFVKRIKNGESTTILSGISGLTFSISPSGKNSLISRSQGGSLELLIYNLESGRYYNSDIYTLPEKCVWSTQSVDVVYCGGQSTAPKGSFPQDWYQGKTNFADTLWRINTKDLTVDEVYTFLGTSESFDMTNLQLSPDETRLLFIDKNDSTPWVLNLN